MRTPTHHRLALPDRLEVHHPPGPHPGLVAALLVLALVVAVAVTVTVVLLVRAAGEGAPSAPGAPRQTLLPQPLPGPPVRV